VQTPKVNIEKMGLIRKKALPLDKKSWLPQKVFGLGLFLHAPLK